MTHDFDLRSLGDDDRRGELFAALEDLDGGDAATVTAAEGLDVFLHQYQFTRSERLEWERVESDDDAATVRVIKGDSLDADDLIEFDVRDMPPQRRHAVLTETFDLLEPGDGFVLVNDHDPKPLYYELQSTRGDVFDWEDLQEDPAAWKTAIVKTAPAETDEDGDVMARFDVREIPKPERHPTIHHRYGNVPEGDAMEIVAPHEPKPLHREFQQRYGDAFDWDVLEKEPGRCRVRITKRSADRDSEVDAGSRADATGDGHADADVRADDPTPGDEVSPEVTAELDVRDRPPAQRHEDIYDAYAALDGGEGFVLVNDHDPKPLYHQFQAEAGEEFYWEYRQKDAGEFRVLIGKRDGIEASETVDDESAAPF